MNKFIPVAEPSITEKEINYVLDTLRSGWVSSLGKYINEFENKFSEFIGVKYALTTTSGTTALHLSLASLGVTKNDEVIIPDLTFVAVANAITYMGAKPIFVDIDPNTWCIDPVEINKAITPRSRAIIPVHIYGHPADMDSIRQIADKNDLFVIEDAAEALGSEYREKKVGSMGDTGVFSFYGNKIITTGEGGMITTNDKRIYERALYLRDHAMSKDKRYWHTEIGFNYRMTNMQAALGLAQLERVEELINKKRVIFQWYKEGLEDLDGIRLNPEKEWAKSVFWMVCLVLEKESGISRDELMEQLRKEGIDTRPFFYPMSQLPMYISDGKRNITKEISGKGVNLPSGINLKNKEVRWIAEMIKKIIRSS